jgi:hypothetical protein
MHKILAALLPVALNGCAVAAGAALGAAEDAKCKAAAEKANTADKSELIIQVRLMQVAVRTAGRPAGGIAAELGDQAAGETFSGDWLCHVSFVAPPTP